MKAMGTPGPGAYDISQSIVTGRMERSVSNGLIRNSTVGRPDHLTECEMMQKDDQESLVRGWVPNYEIGPGAYNVIGDQNKKSFQKKASMKPFNSNQQRFENDTDITKEEKYVKNLQKQRLNTDNDNTYENQAIFVKEIRAALGNKNPFNSSSIRDQPTFNDKEKKPGPGSYISPSEVAKMTKHHNAFKSQTDRGLTLHRKGDNGSIANFMIEMADRDKNNLKQKIDSQRSALNQRPTNELRGIHFKKDIPAGLKHCQLTTIPLDKEKYSLSRAIGDMHKQHREDQHGNRVLPLKMRPELPFGSLVRFFLVYRNRIHGLVLMKNRRAQGLVIMGMRMRSIGIKGVIILIILSKVSCKWSLVFMGWVVFFYVYQLCVEKVLKMVL